jgi:hypothetical protein
VALEDGPHLLAPRQRRPQQQRCRVKGDVRPARRQAGSHRCCCRCPPRSIAAPLRCGWIHCPPRPKGVDPCRVFEWRKENRGRTCRRKRFVDDPEERRARGTEGQADGLRREKKGGRATSKHWRKRHDRREQLRAGAGTATAARASVRSGDATTRPTPQLNPAAGTRENRDEQMASLPSRVLPLLDVLPPRVLMPVAGCCCCCCSVPAAFLRCDVTAA